MQIHALWWPLSKQKVSVGKQPSTPLMHDVHKRFANEMWLQLLVSNLKYNIGLILLNNGP